MMIRSEVIETKRNVIDEMTDEEIFNEVWEALEGSSFFLQKKEDHFEFEICADYRDTLDDKSITEICESEEPFGAFEDWLYDAYFYEAIEAFNEIEDDVISTIEWKYDAVLSDELKESINECLQDVVWTTYPEEHFLKQKVNVDIFVDTGDANYDYVLNCHYPAWGGYEGEVDPKASIRWLAATQGYDEPTLRAALDKGDMADPKGFLESLRVELANAGSQIQALVILAEMSLEDLLELNERLHAQIVNGYRSYDADARPDNGSIHIGRNAEAGLYNSWDGGGSLFEIQLEKDIDLPLKYIGSVLPDGGAGGYSVKSVYGMCGSCWRDVVNIGYKAAEIIKPEDIEIAA